MESREIKVLVLNPHRGGLAMWQHLQVHWCLYGTVPLKLSIVKDFSLDTLVEEEPDVIVCSDTAGSTHEFTDKEADAITQYLQFHTGKHILGTYALFFHQEVRLGIHYVFDNKRLAPLFGFSAQSIFSTTKLTSEHAFCPTKAFQDSVLWKGIALPYKSCGYAQAQKVQAPEDSTNDESFSSFMQRVLSTKGAGDAEVSSASPKRHLVASTEDGLGTITHFVGDTHTALFVSTMPEFKSVFHGQDDAQFFYNAILFLASQTSRPQSLTDLCLTCIAEHFSSPTTTRKLNILPASIRKRLEQVLRVRRRCLLLRKMN